MTESPNQPPKLILIVEDHRLFRSMLVQLISQEPDLKVSGEADTIQDALKLIGQARPDAVIVDLALKKSNGLELIKYLKAWHLQLPVLVLSLQAKKIFAERALRAGAKGYATKQDPPGHVLLAIRTILTGGNYISERINMAETGV